MFTSPRRPRKRGRMDWLLEGQVLLQESDGRKKWTFESWPAYYFHYVCSVLSGGSFAGGTQRGYKALIVRHEDLLTHQQGLVNYFEDQVGLKRNNRPFEMLEEGLGSSRLNRQDLVQREYEACSHFSEEQKNKVQPWLEEYSEVLKAMGYNEYPCGESGAGASGRLAE